MVHGVEDKHNSGIYDTLGYVLSFFNFCTGILATILDIFVIYILLSKRGISKTHGSDMFVVGLTITDFITGAILIFSIMAVFFESGRTICLTQICCIQSSMLCSALFVSLMTSDRFFKIVHPFLYERLFGTEFVPLSISATVYVFSFIIGYLPWMGVGVLDDSDAKRMEWNYCSYLHVIKPSYRIPYLVLLFIPIPTAVLLYHKIFNVAKSHIQSIAQTQGGPTQIPRGRYIKMIFVMAGLYTIFYTLPAVVTVLHDIYPKIFEESEIKSRTIFHLCSVGLIVNPVVNAIIYAYTIPLIKNTFRQALGLPVVEKDLELFSGSSKLMQTSRLLSEGDHTKTKRKSKRKGEKHSSRHKVHDSDDLPLKQHSSKGSHGQISSKPHKRHKKRKHRKDEPDEENPWRSSVSSRRSRKVSSTDSTFLTRSFQPHDAPVFEFKTAHTGANKVDSDDVVHVLPGIQSSSTDLV